MYIERSIRGRFISAAKSNSIVAVVGPRQSGKTTFLKEQSGGAASYILFDDPDVREIFDADVKKFEDQYLKGNKPAILDEIQYGKDPGRKLKYLADSGKRLWVTSSSQSALNKNVLGWLVGRVAIIKLYPFSIREFLTAKGYKHTTDRIIDRATDEHMRYGGYPKVVLEDDTQNKEALLRDLYETMILKDVARTFAIGDIDALEKMAAYLSHSIGGMIAYNSMCRELGLSFQSVKRYLNAMEKSYIIAKVTPFYRNRLKELVKQPKIYFLDTGLRNAVANDFSMGAESAGKLFENYVFTELLKAGMEVKFWQSKGKAEVDFIIQMGGEVIPIEVKLKVVGSHLERSMLSFINSYRPKKGFVVFREGRHSKIRRGRCTIEFVTAIDLVTKLTKEKQAVQDRKINTDVL